jgi:hypothetical protein
MLSGDDGPDFMFPHLRPDWDIDSLLIILLLILSCLSVLFAVQKYFGGIFQAVLSSAGTTHPEKKRSSLDYRLESTVCWLAATLLMLAISLIMRNVVALSYLTLSSQWYFYLSLHLRSEAWNKPTQSYIESGLTYSQTGLYLLLLSYGCKRVWNLLRQLVSVVTSATHHQLHRQRLIPQLIAHVSYPPANLVVVTALCSATASLLNGTNLGLPTIDVSTNMCALLKSISDLEISSEQWTILFLLISCLFLQFSKALTVRPPFQQAIWTFVMRIRQKHLGIYGLLKRVTLLAGVILTCSYFYQEGWLYLLLAGLGHRIAKDYLSPSLKYPTTEVIDIRVWLWLTFILLAYHSWCVSTSYTNSPATTSSKKSPWPSWLVLCLVGLAASGAGLL